MQKMGHQIRNRKDTYLQQKSQKKKAECPLVQAHTGNTSQERRVTQIFCHPAHGHQCALVLIWALHKYIQ